jgi:predicted amidohydrolase YtcJ
MTTADLVLTGGKVRTLDPDNPSAEAVAIKDGLILAVGSAAEIDAYRGETTELIQLGGAAVTPGLIDSHMHPLMGALETAGADLLDAHTIDDVTRILKAEADRTPQDGWVSGWGLLYDVFEGSEIHYDVIEEAVGGRKAAIMFMDFHSLLVSKAALEAAGIDGPREFEEHAEVVCKDGKPTGALFENAAMDLVRDVMPELTEDQELELYAQHFRNLAAVGLTGTHAMDGNLEAVEIYRKLEARGDLITRVTVPFTITPETTEEQWETYAQNGKLSGKYWRTGVAKFFIDGVIDSGTGWLVEPDEMGDGKDPFWPDPERYRRAVKFFAEHGFQCVTHATGDRGVREALNAYRDAGTSGPKIRHRVEHIETIQPDDLPRFAAEGVVASMQTQHMMWLDPDRQCNWSRRLGDDRCDRAFMTRSLRESGAKVALGSDWPVARYDPREGIGSAQLRRPPGHSERRAYDDQAIDGLAALEGYTTLAAYTVGDEERLGRLIPGFCADITVMATDPAATDPDALPETPVLLTIVDGRVVYNNGSL